MCRFVESFEALHADKLKVAEAKALALFMAGDMPAEQGKKRRKAMTEVGFDFRGVSFCLAATLFFLCVPHLGCTLLTAELRFL